ncbi:MAG: M48 family metalloprotease [Pseudanabaenaceae cyanobacterium]
MSVVSLKSAKEALLRKHYTEAIALLQDYCRSHPDPEAPDYIQAQMLLVRAYQGVGRADKAVSICEAFAESADPQLQEWGRKSLMAVRQQLEAEPEDLRRNEEVAEVQRIQPSRYHKKPVIVALPDAYWWLYVGAMLCTVLVMLGIGGSIFTLPLWLIFIEPPQLLINIMLGFSVVVAIIFFFMSPWIIDVTQKQYQKIQWITLADLEPRSPEMVETIEYFCEKYKYIVPRLGWLEDDTPIAFSYGVLPNSARLVVSRGLFRCLDDDEIAAVVSYHLGRIITWSFSVITFAGAPLQIIYLIYVSLMRWSYRAKTGNNIIRFFASIFYVLYRVGNYLLCFVTRRSSYLCDRFATEMTGNPNAVTRALAKMARGLLEYHEPGTPPNRLLEATRPLGFLDYRTSTAVGMALQILYAGKSDRNPYEAFLWELFNPWAGWLQLNSTHPLIAKRIKVLTGYGKQLGLQQEYEFRELLKLEPRIDKKRLYDHFYRDFLIQVSPYIGLAIAFLFPISYEWLIRNYLGGLLNWRWYPNAWLIPSLILISLGISFMFQGSIRYPNFKRVVDSDIVSLLTNIYTNPAFGLPVRVPGEITTYSSDESFTGYALRLTDQGGVMYVHYLPSYKERGKNDQLVIQKLEQILDRSVVVTGWYRRDSTPIIDLHSIQPLLPDETQKPATIYGHHQIWNNLVSSALLGIGLLILLATSPLL